MTREEQIELSAAVMSQWVHRCSRRLGYLFTGSMDTETCKVCLEQATRAFEELERARSMPSPDHTK